MTFNYERLCDRIIIVWLGAAMLCAVVAFGLLMAALGQLVGTMPFTVALMMGAGCLTGLLLSLLLVALLYVIRERKWPDI